MKVRFRMAGKDADLPQGLIDEGWFEFHEYWAAELEVDPKTGKGTIAFDRLGIPKAKGGE